MSTQLYITIVLGQMKVAIIYIFPVVEAQVYVPKARRFAATYMENPPGDSDHQLYVVTNGGEISKSYRRIFEPIPCHHISHNNVGKDIGAYQVCAENIACDLMICLGANIHFWKAGWLDRIVNAYLENGPALYGCWAFHNPSTHVRTTAFWLPPELLRSYPYIVGNDQRYEFEHGENSIVNHATKMNFPSYMVTWGGVYAKNQWHHVEREECLFFDNHCESIGYK